MPAPQCSEGPFTSPSTQGSSRRTDLKRRGFLLALGMSTAGVATLAARSLTGTTDNEHSKGNEPVSRDGGITEHAARYYRTART